MEIVSNMFTRQTRNYCASDKSSSTSMPMVVSLACKALATWRIAHMLVNEDGPDDVIINLRTYLTRPFEFAPNQLMYERVLKGMFSCVWCMSIWVGLVLSILPTRASVPFALSAVAIAIDEAFAS